MLRENPFFFLRLSNRDSFEPEDEWVFIVKSFLNLPELKFKLGFLIFVPLICDGKKELCHYAFDPNFGSAGRKYLHGYDILCRLIINNRVRCINFAETYDSCTACAT